MFPVPTTAQPVLAVAPVPVEGRQSWNRQEDSPGQADTGRASACALHRCRHVGGKGAAGIEGNGLKPWRGKCRVIPPGKNVDFVCVWGPPSGPLSSRPRRPGYRFQQGTANLFMFPSKDGDMSRSQTAGPGGTPPRCCRIWLISTFPTGRLSCTRPSNSGRRPNCPGDSRFITPRGTAAG
ncbi:MAG: hypothetical protein OXD45_10380 [Rhodobacteraceae bacterium]|nr:hypothetical protein [Paracoccaceae bacterium]